VEGGVIMHRVPGFEWYLILERDLPSFLQSPPRLLFTSFVSQSAKALSMPSFFPCLSPNLRKREENFKINIAPQITNNWAEN
ncbi:hypothetical protein, partial [Synechocystis salina]|uniref:hypothetical protein n=1 Tax=Synechocystis salina TaxID=945780 RepID=UPI001D144685